MLLLTAGSSEIVADAADRPHANRASVWSTRMRTTEAALTHQWQSVTVSECGVHRGVIVSAPLLAALITQSD